MPVTGSAVLVEIPCHKPEVKSAVDCTIFVEPGLPRKDRVALPSGLIMIPVMVAGRTGSAKLNTVPAALNPPAKVVP